MRYQYHSLTAYTILEKFEAVVNSKLKFLSSVGTTRRTGTQYDISAFSLHFRNFRPPSRLGMRLDQPHVDLKFTESFRRLTIG